MTAQNSISVIVPALNEAPHLADTVSELLRAAARHFEEHEIIIVDDGSTDETGRIADRLAAAHPTVRAIHHEKPASLGAVFKEGLGLARMHYVTLVNGKNDTTADRISAVWALKGQADMIVPYSEDASYRPMSRRVVSCLFTRLLNLLFGLRLKYYNHFVLHRRALVRTLRVRTDSYAFQAEILVKLIRMGHSYLEVAHDDHTAGEGATKAFRPANLIGVLKFLFWIVYDVHFSGRCRGPKPKVESRQPETADSAAVPPCGRLARSGDEGMQGTGDGGGTS